MIASIFTNNGLTAVIGGKEYTINNTHPNWTGVVRAIEQNDEKLVVRLMDLPATITKWFREGNVRVENGEVFMGTERIGGPVVDKILDFVRNGYPVRPMLRFLDKLMQNPSKTSVQELYSFLEHKNLPINDNGNFLAYKGLRGDYYSITAGKLTLLQGYADAGGHIFNGVGQTIECKRNQVDDNRKNHCSTGIHAGSLEYAVNFAGGGKVVIVEIDPSSVVSVPEDCDCQKLRTSKYRVVSDYTGPLPSSYIHTNEDEPEWEDEYADEDDDCIYGDDTMDDEDDARYSCGYDAGYDRAITNKSNYVSRIPVEQRNAWEVGFNDGYTDARGE